MAPITETPVSPPPPPPPLVKKEPTPLPRKPIYILCAILFCESFVSSMLFPFVNFMVRDFGIAKNESEIGYYSGYLASSFFLGQFASSYFWGYLSDKYGRRPILLVGVFGSMVSASLFGFSSSYTMAIAVRTFGGLMNSNFAIARSYLGDITDETNRVRGFSFIGLMWGAGSVVGPSTGGLLSNPGDHVTLSDGHILRQFPYMLPSIVGGILSFISWFIAFILLKESNKAVIQCKALQKEEKAKVYELKELQIASESLLNEEDREDMIKKEKDLVQHRSELLISEDEESEDEEEKPNQKRSLWGLLTGLKSKKTRKNKYAHLSEEDGATPPAEVQPASVAPADSITLSPIVTPEPKKGFAASFEIFRERCVIVCIILLSMAGLCVVAIDEIFPLWAMNPAPVGINFQADKIGLSWAIGGVTLVVFQGMIYPKFANKVGLLYLVRFGSIGFAITYISYPMLGFLANTGILLWIGLGAVLCGRYVFGSSVGTTLNILVNSVGGELVKQHRGVVNGVAMSASGLARAIAPVFGSTIFAWSNTNGLSFPLNHFFVFEVMSFLLIAILFLSFLIPKNSVK